MWPPPCVYGPFLADVGEQSSPRSHAVHTPHPGHPDAVPSSGVQSGDLDRLRLLIARGADVNAQTTDMTTSSNERISGSPLLVAT